MKKISVLIVDDSKTMTALLRAIFDDTADISVIGCAEDGEQAVMMTQQLKPNVVIMDIMMPNMNGFEATQKIMETCPTPVIILSSLVSSEQMQSTYKALLMGALAALPKFTGVMTDDFDMKQQAFLEQIRMLSDVRLVPRHKRENKTSLVKKALVQPVKILGLGVSTGGPEALATIVSSLDRTFPAPIVAVLHISNGFLEGLVQWLQKRTTLILKIATHQEALLPGTLYFAPDNYHLMVQQGVQPRAILKDEPPMGYFKPAIAALFSSLAVAYPGECMAGLLTGMGSDGVDSLAAMKEVGCYTFVQSEATCVVAGMTHAAKKMGVVDGEVDLDQIAVFLKMLVQQKKDES